MRRPLVFATRKFPPSVGGMETLSQHVWTGFSTTMGDDAVLVAHGGPNRSMPLWLPYAVARVVWLVLVRRARLVVVGDALLHVVLRPVLAVLRATDVCMVMGLDVTWDNRPYQWLVRRTLPSADRVLAISRATAREAERRGVAPARVTVVRLGVEAPVVAPDERADARRHLVQQLGLGEDVLLLGTLGRLVRRKGAAWFVSDVLGRLPDHVHHVIAGAGPDDRAVRAAASAAGVEARVHLLGGVDAETRERVLRGVDVFVQPNVPVAGDMEGFGLVTIEAALRGTPVVAADLEGIADAVVDGETGDLLPAQDAAAWAARLSGLVEGRASLPDLGAERAARAAELYGAEQMTRTITQAVDHR